MNVELLKTLLYDIRKEKDLGNIHRLIMVYQDDDENLDDEDLDFVLEEDD